MLLVSGVAPLTNRKNPDLGDPGSGIRELGSSPPMHIDSPTHLAGGKPADAGDFILERRARLVRPYFPAGSGSLLDFGCGNGAQSAHFLDDFNRITGVDVEPGFITEFRARFCDLLDRVEGVLYDGCTLPIPDSEFDCAVSFEVLEHVADESSSLKELHRVLKPGGILAMSVPNRWWIFETHGAELPLLPWNRVPFFSWLPKAIHDRWARARIYRRREIVRLLGSHGFEVQASAYITAPMDVVKQREIQRFLRRTLFRGDTTRLPFMSTAVLVIARRA